MGVCMGGFVFYLDVGSVVGKFLGSFNLGV